jgi:hypothetical protein
MFEVTKTSLLALGFTMAALAAIQWNSAEAAEEKQAKELRHVVLFKFKPDTSKEQVQEVVDAFAVLPKKIDSIKHLDWGTDISVENRAEGFTHCFIVTFADAKGRDTYLPHPAHKEFGALVGPRLEKVLVFDFMTQ